MALDYQTEAILLATRDWRAADRMVTLFSREQGIMIVMAYNARKPKNKLSGSLQPFMHLHVQLSTGRGMEAVKQCEVQTSFREIREDLTRLAYANFIVELVLGLYPPQQAEPAVFYKLLDVFSLLSGRNPRIAALTGAWHLLALAGFQPEYDSCTYCGCPLHLPACFSFSGGGSCCSRCCPPDAVKFMPSDRDFLHNLLQLNIKQPGQFSVKAATLSAAEHLLYGFIRYQLDKPLKSLEFIRKLTVLS